MKYKKTFISNEAETPINSNYFKILDFTSFLAMNGLLYICYSTRIGTLTASFYYCKILQPEVEGVQTEIDIDSIEYIFDILFSKIIFTLVDYFSFLQRLVRGRLE
jgi:hypothetical protein